MGKKNGGEETTNGKSDLERVGLFREMGYVTLKDPYKGNQEKPFCLSKFKGKQFQVSGNKNSVYFDKAFSRVFQGEGYAEPLARDRKLRQRELKKNIGKPFKPSGDLGRRTGHGNLYASFEGPKTAMSPLERNKQPQKPLGKNFVTKPGRKGTGYGYVDVTIGKSHDYHSTPYEPKKSQAKEERHTHVKKMVGGPFISHHFPKPVFDSEIYKPQSDKAILEEAPTPEKKVLPFRPSHPSKSGIQGCLNTYPKQEPEPHQPIMRREKLKKIFKPPGQSKSTVSRSIALMNVPLSRNVYV